MDRGGSVALDDVRMLAHHEEKHAKAAIAALDSACPWLFWYQPNGQPEDRKALRVVGLLPPVGDSDANWGLCERVDVYLFWAEGDDPAGLPRVARAVFRWDEPDGYIEEWPSWGLAEAHRRLDCRDDQHPAPAAAESLFWTMKWRGELILAFAGIGGVNAGREGLRRLLGDAERVCAGLRRSLDAGEAIADA